MKQSKIINRLAEFKIRIDRGNALLYWIKNILIMVAGIKLIIPSTPLFVSIFLIPALIIIVYFVGWLDLNRFKLFQREAELGTGKYNPYFKKKLG